MERTAEFKLEYSTKNTHRYKEVAEEGEEMMGTAYIKQSVLGNLAPQNITITVKTEEG